MESKHVLWYEEAYEKGTRARESLCSVHPGQISYSVVAPCPQGKPEAHLGARGNNPYPAQET